MVTTKYVHYLPAGGLGDLFREAFYHNALGILKRFKLENPSVELKLLLMSHNPAAAELFAHQSWIDETKVVPYKVEDVGNWPSCYTDHKDEFEGYVELRFNIPDHRSNYRSDLLIHRPRDTAFKTITPVGMPWDVVLAEEEWAQVEALRGRTLFHPHAGSFQRTISEDVADWLRATYGANWLEIGANYIRDQHTEEQGATLNPRVLVEVIRRATAVLGTESSVYYIASMVGVPTCMLYRDGHAFARWMHNNDATWDWFFNTRDPRSQFIRMPLDDNARVRIGNWVTINHA